MNYSPLFFLFITAIKGTLLVPKQSFNDFETLYNDGNSSSSSTMASSILSTDYSSLNSRYNSGKPIVKAGSDEYSPITELKIIYIDTKKNNKRKRPSVDDHIQ